MSVLTVCHGTPCVEIPDHKSEVWPYGWAITRGRSGLVVIFTCLDPKTGEPALDRSGRQRTYAVTLGDGWTSCPCPDSRYRARREGRLCKHGTCARELVPLLRAMGHPAVAPAKEQAS